MKREDVVKDKLVKYEGLNRTYLKQYPTAKLSGEYSASNKSAYVYFYNQRGDVADYAWVGLDYLSPVALAHQGTIDTLRTKREELLVQAAGLETAIKALEDLG